MTKNQGEQSPRYIDARGVTWDTAEEALQDFIDDLPPLTDEEIELLFSATDRTWSAERNLKAIDFSITYHGLADKFGYYPVPEPDVCRVQDYGPARQALLDRAFEDRGWTWDSLNPLFMVARDVDWDMLHTPIFQYQRQQYNRRVLASLGPPYEKVASAYPPYREYKERM